MMSLDLFAFRHNEPISDFSLAERLIGDTVTWAEISRQRLENSRQDEEGQCYA